MTWRITSARSASPRTRFLWIQVLRVGGKTSRSMACPEMIAAARRSGKRPWLRGIRPILIGDETTPATAKRFGTRENQVAEERPKLTVQFTLPILPPEGGLQIPGNINQDATLDISDAVATLGALFLGIPARFPCGNGDPTEPGNAHLLDWQPDG